MDFFIADTHFYDDDIIIYENRPFSNADEMLETLINNWNKTVRENDRVFVLGDFIKFDSICKSDCQANVFAKEINPDIFRNLNGKKYLVRGNHDIECDQVYIDMGFEKIYDFPVILDDFWILSHKPLYINANMPYANIYGHIHGNDMYKDYSPHSYCVSAERINYTPISFDKIKGIIAQERKKSI